MKKVSIYTTPFCVYCRKAKDFFERNKISYAEFNVLNDIKRRDEMVSKSGQLGVPVIDVEGSLIIGFDERRLRELLGV